MSHAIQSLYFVTIRSDWPGLMSKFELRVGRYFDSLVKLLIWRERKSDRFIFEEKNMGEKQQLSSSPTLRGTLRDI